MRLEVQSPKSKVQGLRCQTIPPHPTLSPGERAGMGAVGEFKVRSPKFKVQGLKSQAIPPHPTLSPEERAGMGAVGELKVQSSRSEVQSPGARVCGLRGAAAGAGGVQPGLCELAWLSPAAVSRNSFIGRPADPVMNPTFWSRKGPLQAIQAPLKAFWQEMCKAVARGLQMEGLAHG